MGSAELTKVAAEAKRATLLKRPAWEMLSKDLSGNNNEQVYLWIMKGEGRSVFTEIKLVLAPASGQRGDADADRKRSMRHSGTVIAGHDKLEFELHGCATRKQGGADPAVSDIELSFGQVQVRER